MNSNLLQIAQAFQAKLESIGDEEYAEMPIELFIALYPQLSEDDFIMDLLEKENGKHNIRKVLSNHLNHCLTC